MATTTREAYCDDPERVAEFIEAHAIFRDIHAGRTPDAQARQAFAQIQEVVRALSRADLEQLCSLIAMRFHVEQAELDNAKR